MSEVIDGVEYLDGDEVAALLGVKKATLYAYVSRGVLRSYRQRVGRRRLYRRDEVARLRMVQPDASEQPGARGEGGADLPDAASWAGDH